MRIELAIRLLESVLDGSLDANSAVSQWPSIDTETNHLMKNTWHELYHYMDDADLRSDRPSYAAAAEERLRRRVGQLKELLSE